MRHILLIITCVVFAQLHAQNVQLSLIENSIKQSNDTLYFRYSISNKSSYTLALYNVRLVDFDFARPKGYENFKRIFPGLLIKVLDKKNKLLNTLIHTSSMHNPNLEDLITKSTVNKFITLKPNGSVEFKHFIYIGEIGYNRGMIKGKYNLQLTYISSDFYKDRFRKIQKRNKRLKGVELFQGIVESNICNYDFPGLSAAAKKRLDDFYK